jgi:hypothetical protein
MAEDRAEFERQRREEAVQAAVLARDAQIRDASWLARREQYLERRRASRRQQKPTSKTEVLRATATAAAANRRTQEAKLELAIAEESRLDGLWGVGPNTTTAEDPQPSCTGKGEAVTAVVAEGPLAEVAVGEEAAPAEPEAVRGKGKKVVRFALPEDPEPSLEGRGRVEAEVAQEPAMGEHSIVPPGPETATQESLADEPNPEAEQGEAKAGDDAITEEPETPLEGRVKVDEDIAEEPEAPLEGKVKADGEVAEELEFSSEMKVKADAEEPESSLETKVEVDQVAEEPESSLERREKADQIADEPEASLERTASEDAMVAEPEPKTSSEDEAMVEAAQHTPAKSETEPSYEGGEMMDAEQVAAEPSPEVEQEEVMADATPADEPETAEPIGLAHELEKVEATHADELETAEPIGLAQEPEKAEPTASLADAPMSEPSYGGEDEVMAEHSDEPEFTNDDDEMLIDEPQPFDEQEAAVQMMAEQERLAIEEHARAEAHANHLAELQRAEAQRRAEEEDENRLRLQLVAALALHDQEQAEAAERARQEEQRALLEAEMVARLQAEEEQARLAAQAAAEAAHAEEVGMPDAATPVPNADADMSQSVGADEDMSLTEEELQYLHTQHDSFSMDEQEEPQEDSLFGDFAWEEALDTAIAAATDVPLLTLPTAVNLTLPTTTPTPTPTPTIPAQADHTPPTGSQAGPNFAFAFGQAAHQTTPDAVVPPVSSFTFGVDTLAAAAAPTGLHQAEAADAEPASAGEAEPRLAVPADPAARRILPARGVRRRLQARLGAAQELRESQTAPVVVPETQTGVFGGEINVDLDDWIDPALFKSITDDQIDPRLFEPQTDVNQDDQDDTDVELDQDDQSDQDDKDDQDDQNVELDDQDVKLDPGLRPHKPWSRQRRRRTRPTPRGRARPSPNPKPKLALRHEPRSHWSSSSRRRRGDGPPPNTRPPSLRVLVWGPSSGILCPTRRLVSTLGRRLPRPRPRLLSR